MGLTLLRFLLASCLTASLLDASPDPDKRRLIIAAPNFDDQAFRTQAAWILPALPAFAERDFAIETKLGRDRFSVTLIGKDGHEKLRRSTPLAPAELFAIIDAMPMRRAEIEARSRLER